MEALIGKAGSQNQGHVNHAAFYRESGRRRQRCAKGKQKLWLNREISGLFYQEKGLRENISFCCGDDHCGDSGGRQLVFGKGTRLSVTASKCS